MENLYPGDSEGTVFKKNLLKLGFRVCIPLRATIETFTLSYKLIGTLFVTTVRCATVPFHFFGKNVPKNVSFSDKIKMTVLMMLKNSWDALKIFVKTFFQIMIYPFMLFVPYFCTAIENAIDHCVAIDSGESLKVFHKFTLANQNYECSKDSISEGKVDLKSLFLFAIGATTTRVFSRNRNEEERLEEPMTYAQSVKSKIKKAIEKSKVDITDPEKPKLSEFDNICGSL